MITNHAAARVQVDGMLTHDNIAASPAEHRATTQAMLEGDAAAAEA